MITANQALNDFKDTNNVIVDDKFFEFDTEHYENHILAAKPWRKE